MNFSKHLATQVTPEWRKQYIQYESLKATIYDIKDHPDGQDQLHAEFFDLIADELAKVNLFFTQKVAESTGQFRQLANQVAVLKQLSTNGSVVRRKLHIGSATSVSDKELKHAFREFHLSLILLQNYQKLNALAFRKILEKFDKVVGSLKGRDWRKKHVKKAPFYVDNEVENLLEEVEKIYIDDLELGDKTKAMRRLKVPPLQERATPHITFRLGFYLGLLLASVVVSGVVIHFHSQIDSDTFWSEFRWFRGFLLFFIHIFLVGVNMHGWRRAGVNHVLIFELDPRNYVSYQSLMELGTFGCFASCAFILLSVCDAHLHISAFVWPVVLFCGVIIWLINPLGLWYKSSRMWLLRQIFRCFSPPWHHVGFADFWLGDQMVSLTTIFLDVEYYLCFYITSINWTDDMSMMTVGNSTANNHMADICASNIYGIRPVVSCLPALFRFLQCCRRYRDTKAIFPHLVNAGKYFTTILVAIVSAANVWYETAYDIHQPTFILGFWILAYAINTAYSLAWDLKMDWGFFERGSKHKFLREELVYERPIYYYLAMVEDLILRLAWILTVIFHYNKSINGEIITCITAILELIRRFVWNFFRLENEHINNCGQFRAVRDISLKPLRSKDLNKLFHMQPESRGSLAGLDPLADDSAPNSRPHSRIRHISVLAYENRLFDNFDRDRFERQDSSRPPSFIISTA